MQSFIAPNKFILNHNDILTLKQEVKLTTVTKEHSNLYYMAEIVQHLLTQTDLSLFSKCKYLQPKASTINLISTTCHTKGQKFDTIVILKKPQIFYINNENSIFTLQTLYFTLQTQNQFICLRSYNNKK